MNETEFDKMLDVFLRTRGCTLWMNWDITDEQERKDAVEWLKQLFVDVSVFADGALV